MIGYKVAALAAFFIACIPAHADEETAADFFRKWGPQSMRQAQPSRQMRTMRQPRGHQPPAHVHQLITAKAQKHGVPVRLAHAVVSVESRYNCGARSRSNARGLMQVLPATARGVGVTGNLYDCTTGAEAGMRYLSMIIRRHGTGCGAISLYNRGHAARPVCTQYGRMVLARQ